MSAVEQSFADRGEWLSARRRGIGASEAAAVLGLSPFESPLQVYLRKLGRTPDAEETEAMRWGSLMEPVLARQYERESGRRVVREQVFVRSTDHPHLFATLDGVTDAGHPVELKTISGWKAADLGDEHSDEIPDHWLVQSYLQLWLADADRVDFAVLVWGNTPRFRRFAVERTPRVDQALADILPHLHEFWGQVQRQDPPPVEMGTDPRIIAALYPDPDGSIELAGEALDVVGRMEAASAAAREYEAAAKAARGELLALLGNAREGSLPDGRRVRRYDQSFPEATVVRKAYSTTTVKVLKARS